MMKLTQIMKDSTADFSHEKDGTAFYVVRVFNVAYIFPIKVTEIKKNQLKKKSPALTYIKWINKSISEKTFIRVA